MKNALMKKTRTSPQLLCAALLLAGSALAQAQAIKPGLWEIKMNPQLSPERQAAMAQAQQQLAQMPAEQRKMMEEMMAKAGVNANLATGAVTLKVCITPEQAALNQLPVSSQGNCKHQLERKGAQILNRFSCSEPELSGEGTTTLSSAEAYSSNMNSTTRVGGKTETMSVQSQGRWLSGDCGGIAPMKTSK
ncbi:DUF3617 domain-containing protein [Paucibacter sp. DJ1R-11]|uniref:DUF3617 domain-containing protein n=1 Tax=Paucibacter sp. DJ1R-11 TaxID=2893556 RepID=UPI0021E48185|nr:DUF3617 domain-containing protein [Paucibacter sp. DJ1R-11]MCV2362702.1 DUF3617 domain-containing protein [Paucibacter sp. DJ1R-11]